MGGVEREEEGEVIGVEWEGRKKWRERKGKGLEMSRR